MTIQHTTRANIPYPQGSDAAVVHADLQAVAEAADTTFAMYSSGTRAARPSTGKEGQIYRQTDASAGYPVHTLWWYNGAAWTLLFDPNGTHATPTGVMVSWAGTAAQVPAGWVACDGSAVTAAANPLLRQFLIDAGSPYGTSGSDPRTPDCRGRVDVGLDNMGSSDAGRLDVANTLGGVGGEQYHVLTTSEIAAHSHPVTVSNAGTGVSAATSSAGGHTHVISSGGSHTHTVNTAAGTTGAAGSHSHGGSTSVDGSHAHNLRKNDGTNIGAVSVPTGAVSAALGSGGTARYTGQGTQTFMGDTDAQGSHSHTIGTDTAANHTHTVTIDSGGSHTHGIDTVAAHTHTVTVTDPQHTHTASSSNTGGGGSHNNMQPYLLVNKIIKA